MWVRNTALFPCPQNTITLQSVGMKASFLSILEKIKNWEFLGLVGTTPFSLHQKETFLQVAPYTLLVEAHLEAKRVSTTSLEYPHLDNTSLSNAKLSVCTFLVVDALVVPVSGGWVWTTGSILNSLPC